MQQTGYPLELGYIGMVTLAQDGDLPKCPLGIRLGSEHVVDTFNSNSIREAPPMATHSSPVRLSIAK